MDQVTAEFLAEQVELSEQLLAGRDTMLQPQDLPGRYGRVVGAIDHLLGVMECESVLAGGWAVWRHGYSARVTQDLDIVLPADRIEEFLRVACVSGFKEVVRPAGRWPKLLHKETDVTVDILPEGARPGTTAKPAPTTIPHPARLGARGNRLTYPDLTALIQLKLAAGRVRDESDVVEVMRENMDKAAAVQEHLSTVHADYVQAFDRLIQRAREEEDA